MQIFRSQNPGGGPNDEQLTEKTNQALFRMTINLKLSEPNMRIF